MPQIEATANEHEKLNVEGFPTLLFFPASNKGESVAYDGADRSLKVSSLWNLNAAFSGARSSTMRAADHCGRDGTIARTLADLTRV